MTIHFTQHTEADSGQDAAQTGTVQPGVSVAQAPTTTVTPTQEVEPAIAIDVPIGPGDEVFKTLFAKSSPMERFLGC